MLRYTNLSKFPKCSIMNPDLRKQASIDIRGICSRRNKNKLVDIEKLSYTFQDLLQDILKIKKSKKFKYVICFDEFRKQHIVFDLAKYRTNRIVEIDKKRLINLRKEFSL